MAIASTAIHRSDVDIYAGHSGDGPDVLLIAGLGDPLEAWQFQLDGLADRYHMIAYDNRGVGRTPLPAGPFSVATMADDAAAVLRGLGVSAAHVAGFSGGSVIARELTYRHPELVKSLVLVGTFAQWDTFGRTAVNSWRWQADTAPSERAFLEAFYTWIYTARAHEDGTVNQIIDDVMEFPYPTSMETMQQTMDAYLAHEDIDRLNEIDVPTLVLTGELDLICPPRHGRVVAAGIPGAVFEILTGEAHQPFQESPEAFNRRVDDFWQQVETHTWPQRRTTAR
ncbi:MAG TPA: alpha/beta fold hydrolase [Microlunatus sp.]